MHPSIDLLNHAGATFDYACMCMHACVAPRWSLSATNLASGSSRTMAARTAGRTTRLAAFWARCGAGARPRSRVRVVGGVGG
eukprot:161459-Chlamydomonas_euryale.AAC.1